MCSLLMFFAERFHGYLKIASYICYALVVILTSTLAACRDMTCGVDIYVYENLAFNQAKAAEDFSQLCDSSLLEPLFLFINYSAAGISNHIGAAFFLIQAIIMSLWVAACVKVKDMVPSWITLPLLILGFYPLSFNLMRQCLAIAFLTYAYADLLKTDNLKRFVVMCVLAYFFHKTAVAAGVLLLVIHWAWSLKSDAKKKFFFVMICLGCFLVVFLFIQVLELIGGLGGKFAQYAVYGGTEGGKRGFKPGILTILLFGEVLCLFVTIFLYKKNLLSKRIAYVYSLILVASIAFENLGRYAGYATRFDMYFCALQCFFIPIVFRSKSLSPKMRMLGSVLSVLIFIAVFMRLSDSMGGTVPYRSSLLGFV